MAKPDSPPVVRRRVALDLEDGEVDDRYVVMVPPPPKADDETGYLLAGLLLGAALGAAVGLFLAPRSGDETRRAIKSRLPLVGAGAAEDDTEAAPGSEPVARPAPTNAPPGALDPVAQVAQYQEPPVAAVSPPYTAGDAAPPDSTA